MSDAEDKKEAKTEAKPFNEQDRCFRCGIKGHYRYSAQIYQMRMWPVMCTGLLVLSTGSAMTVRSFTAWPVNPKSGKQNQNHLTQKIHVTNVAKLAIMRTTVKRGWFENERGNIKRSVLQFILIRDAGSNLHAGFFPWPVIPWPATLLISATLCIS